MFKTLAVFGQELLDNPRSVGAACPSSPLLANRIARLVGQQSEGYVIELGAGTGAITKALLAAGLLPRQLVPVERSARLAAHLRRRFPKLDVLHGDACELGRLVESLPHLAGRQVTHIVSSLPLRSLPPADVATIFDGVRRVLAPDGLFIQYTYAVRQGTAAEGLHWCARSVVWLNLPPARVDVFAAAPETAAAFRQSVATTGLDSGLMPAWQFGDSDVAC